MNISDHTQASHEKAADGLQIAASHDRDVYEAPQAYHEEPKYPVDCSWQSAPQAITSDEKELTASRDQAQSNGKRRTCGCSPVTFYILAGLLALAIIGAAVGGGVGGSLAASQGAATTVTVTAAPAPPRTSTLASPSSTSSTPTDTNSTRSFYFAVYADTDFTGLSRNVTAEGNYSLPFSAQSYVWNQQDADCCALFCRNGQDIGYRCSQVTHQNNITGGGVDKVAVQCSGGDASPPGTWCAE
ncbi:hypothetical protein MPH_11560 [Macrophomina phaseolina MS6]|uniref:Uncharacterized protein n=2 Tax=Macrophomina phaseolina TaxID=35725 RepID=K2S3L3_MACPH|nr:hypothetical protein MPH_11560 [Macrophomina phaseolina MS6]KAH7025566.1 hypothetical protein B0J12DRAFT_704956 [Macrophomina phaseolina]